MLHACVLHLYVYFSYIFEQCSTFFAPRALDVSTKTEEVSNFCHTAACACIIYMHIEVLLKVEVSPEERRKITSQQRRATLACCCCYAGDMHINIAMIVCNVHISNLRLTLIE